ncbi:MAG: DUF1569 domain-containing protein [Fuerstiella sp.]
MDPDNAHEAKVSDKGASRRIQSTSNFIPEAVSVEDGLSAMRNAVARQKEDAARALHPGFGRLTRDDWDDFHLRHAELHMSFLADGE